MWSVSLPTENQAVAYHSTEGGALSHIKRPSDSERECGALLLRGVIGNAAVYFLALARYAALSSVLRAFVVITALVISVDTV